MHSLAAVLATEVKVGGWIAWVILAGSLSTAVVAIWKAVVPVVRMAVKFNETWPVLEQIGEDFRRDHGSSLRDRIERMDGNVEMLGSVTIEENGRPMTRPLPEVVAELHKYSHANNHLLVDRVTSVEGWQKLYEGLVAKIPDPVASST
jgi:hypothetical protein